MVDAVDSSITPYKNIGQVPPSHSISVEKNKVTLKRYSYVTQGKRLKLKSDEEYVEAFQSVFQEAVNVKVTNTSTGWITVKWWIRFRSGCRFCGQAAANG